MIKEIKGVCFLHSETGMEGGRWAMQQDGFADEDGYWSYQGLQHLEEGDDFTVFADNGSVLWHGTIRRDTKTGAVPRRVIRKGKVVTDRSWKKQVAGGMWVHWIQKGIDPEEWGKLFIGERRCLVRREEKT
jgi:hypothetical protein